MYTLKEFKEKFDPLLEEFINKKINSYLEKVNDPFIKDFVYYSKNLVTGGGKRIRPYIAYLAYKSFGGKNDNEALEFFVSLELFHNFLLMQDDITDKNKTRHGHTTVHEHILEKLNNDKRLGDLKHVSESQAMYVGDLLFSWTNELFTDKNDKVKSYFYKALEEVVMGQMIDVDLSTRENSDFSLIEEKMILKTATYSFIRPMQIGAAFANPNYGQEEFFEHFGRNLGLAFQIQDDLLDIIGTAEEIRKTPLNDIAEHQHTFFTNYILTKGTDEQKKYFQSIFGKEVKPEEIEKVKQLFINSGAIKAGQDLVIEYSNQAKKNVEQSNFEEEYKLKFQELIELLSMRKN